MLEGVTIAEGGKDELVISGNDIENVSQSAASITDRCRVKEKDVRFWAFSCSLFFFCLILSSQTLTSLVGP
jgi:ribosomal protein L6P/L9E